MRASTEARLCYILSAQTQRKKPDDSPNNCPSWFVRLPGDICFYLFSADSFHGVFAPLCELAPLVIVFDRKSRIDSRSFAALGSVGRGSAIATTRSDHDTADPSDAVRSTAEKNSKRRIVMSHLPGDFRACSPSDQI